MLEVIQNVQSGQLSYNKGKPLIVSRLDEPRGHFFVMDGHHRVVEAAMAGHHTIEANIDEHMPRIERTGGAFKNMIDGKVRIIDHLG